MINRILWQSIVGFLALCPAAVGRDCNGNGVEDVDDIARGLSQDCNQNAVPDECEGWPVRFSAGSAQALEGVPRMAISGDVNDDGFTDLLIAEDVGDGSILSVLLNNQTRMVAPLTKIPLAGVAQSLAWSDMNGDALTDIVVAKGTGGMVLWNEGGGRFDSDHVLALGFASEFVHAGDFNGDQIPDLASVHQDKNVVTVMLNQSDAPGTFANPIEIAITGSQPVAVASGDLDRDGDLDLVAANRGSSDYSILLNDGVGGFLLKGDFNRGGASVDVSSLNVADLNGDGLLDIASTNATFHSILYNLGDGVFGEPVMIRGESIFSGLASLGTADVDHDGDLDMVTSSSREGVMIRQNDGEGTFTQTWKLGYGHSASTLANGDFDGDGWVDLVMMSKVPFEMGMIWNDGGGGAASEGFEVEVLSLDGCSDARGCRPHGGTLADLDGDGDLDGIGLMTHPGEFHFVDNERGIMVTRPDVYTFGRDGAANGEHSQWVAPGDLDNDGDMDLVTVDNNSHEFWIHINQGDGSFEPVDRSRRLRVGRSPQFVSLGDLDGDGDLDGIASNMGQSSLSILIGNGDGTFLPEPITISTGSAPRGTAIGDLNDDGYNDIVVAHSSGRSIGIILNNGDGTFPSKGSTKSLTGNPYGVALGDFDKDGDLDIAAAVGDRQSCAILLNQGKSIFGNTNFSSPDYYPIEERGAYSITAVDMDGDNQIDLVTANEAGGSVTILHGHGDGSFRGPESYSVGSGAGNRMALPGDLDGDGDLDLMTFNRGNHTATVLYNRTALDSPNYVTTICTVADLLALSAQTSSAETVGQEFVKFTLPAGNEEAALQEIVYQNSNRFRLHQDFLTQVFPQSFPALDAATYDNLVGRRDSRHYFVGAIRVIRTPKGALYGFDVFARFGDSKERLTVSEVQAIHTQLKESFHLEPLVYAPTSLEAVESARIWQQGDTGFPILIEGSTGGYEPYTLGVGYGRVRILSSEAFEEANEQGGISFQDILILERAPRDIEGVVNGIITAERQGELSHVAIRTARRGTPNAFVRTALEDFQELAGKLIRLQVTDTGYTTREVTESEATAFWEANAGSLSHQPVLDPAYGALPSLDEIAAMDTGDGPSIESRVGGKASNLARLQSILTDSWERYRLKGFAIPMSYYIAFMQSNRLPSAIEPEREVTYEEYLQELLENERFVSDSQFRFQSLAVLREHMRDFGKVEESLVSNLHERIAEVMETPENVRVRFRSSSNAEDAVEFNGAGLYDSTQGCVADDLDGDAEGPSHCNASKKGERDLTRALKRVWSSLWNFRAFEERAFYRIDHTLPAMGVLVSEAFDSEQTNGVATTGNATNRLDPRYVITVQKDDHSVVSPEPGVLPEKNILEMSAGGEVTNIIRAVASTLVEPGEFVLSDAELRELGALMWHIDQHLSVDPGAHKRQDIVLEIEFKKRSTGELAVKQVRPFLLTERGPVPPVFELEIPANTVLCAKFDAPNLSRSVQDEAALKSQIHLIGGVTDLPGGIDQFSGKLVEKLVFGQDRLVATGNEPGLFTLEKLPGDEAGLLIYRFQYTQSLSFPDGAAVDVKWSLLDFRTRDGVVVDQKLTLNEAYLIDQLALQATIAYQGVPTTNFYGSCTLEPLQLWDIETEWEDGTKVSLQERFRNEAFGDFQPAALVSARLEIAGNLMETSDYWNLVYKATRHNEHVEHLIILDEPVTVPRLERAVHAIQVIAPTHDLEGGPEGMYLDRDLQEIDHVGIATYQRKVAQDTSRTSYDPPEVALVPIEEGGVIANFVLITLESTTASIRIEASQDLIDWDVTTASLHSRGVAGGVERQTWRLDEPVSRNRSRYLRILRVP